MFKYVQSEKSIRYIGFLYFNKGLRQNNLKHDDKPFLNFEEWQFLNSQFENEQKNFSFENNKVAFIQGHPVNDIITKSKFFEIHIDSYIKKNIKLIISFTSLIASQKMILVNMMFLLCRFQKF